MTFFLESFLLACRRPFKYFRWVLECSSMAYQLKNAFDCGAFLPTLIRLERSLIKLGSISYNKVHCPREQQVEVLVSIT